MSAPTCSIDHDGRYTPGLSTTAARATRPASATSISPLTEQLSWAIHPTAGATVIGARPLLVAYNVYLGGVENLDIAKAVAKAVRGSSGGLRNVKALGLEVDGLAQVSMNLVDTDQTPLSRVFDMVRTASK